MFSAKLKILFFFFFLQSIGFAQSNELFFLKGKIVCSVKELSQVNVFNLRSESSTATDENGDYSLFVKVGDTLKFASLQVETKKIVILETDLKKPLFVTALTPNTIALEEVQIKDYKNINAVSLGILEKPAKHYSPAERRLRAAEELHWYSPLLIPVGGMSVDGLLNSISGRTAMLKKEVVIEKKEKLLLKIENQFGADYFTQKLKIPPQNVRGFWYYAVDDERLENALNTKNKTKASFILAELAINYLALQKQ
ncbi:hypothetical protein [Flavobacterium sp.]|uniref:hypothetical protein n=1 Tax=Flavobacterium sp. TaxID=239 RepID=UPI002FDA9CBE